MYSYQWKCATTATANKLSRTTFGVKNVAGTSPSKAIETAFSIGHNLLWSADMFRIVTALILDLLAEIVFLFIWVKSCEKGLLTVLVNTIHFDAFGRATNIYVIEIILKIYFSNTLQSGGVS